MLTRPRAVLALGAGLLIATLLPGTVQASTGLRVSSTVTTTLSTTMPVVRLHFSQPVSASALPALRVRPSVATVWQQIGPAAVQAVVTGSVSPLVQYVVEAPTRVSCSSTCRFTGVRAQDTDVVTNELWLEQLLAELEYLPLTFTPSVATADPAQQTPGTFTWAYPELPTSLSSLWVLGEPNVIVKGALMAFQSVEGLATTGLADSTTWSDLLAAVEAGTTDPNSYNYVSVSEASPETLTLYVDGVRNFRTLANTGVPGALTTVGTFPVYERYVNQIMRGKNLDGTSYADPVSWVSYFHDSEALHMFPRYSYGWPQSLGCVEMPLDSAKYVWPFTPIGTLVTVSPS